MTDILEPFDHTFPCTEFPHALFYEWDNVLRFELGGEDVPTSRPLKRFNQAMHRAHAVAEVLFQKTEALWLLTSYYGEKPNPKKRLKPLNTVALSPPKPSILGPLPKMTQTILPNLVAIIFGFGTPFN
ncbi:MAG: hypothetical protein GY892_04180 [Shimia sp.]|nr:hypothetical protein [Shimia sp.]